VKEIIYVPYIERVRYRKLNARKREFFVLFWFIWSYKAEGGKMWQRFILFTLQLFCSILLVPLDAILILVKYTFIAVGILLNEFKDTLKLLFATIIKRFIGTFLLIAGITIPLLLLYVKWNEIIDFIDKL